MVLSGGVGHPTGIRCTSLRLVSLSTINLPFSVTDTSRVAQNSLPRPQNPACDPKIVKPWLDHGFRCCFYYFGGFLLQQICCLKLIETFDTSSQDSCTCRYMLSTSTVHSPECKTLYFTHPLCLINWIQERLENSKFLSTLKLFVAWQSMVEAYCTTFLKKYTPSSWLGISFFCASALLAKMTGYNVCLCGKAFCGGKKKVISWSCIDLWPAYSGVNLGVNLGFLSEVISPCCNQSVDLPGIPRSWAKCSLGFFV